MKHSKSNEKAINNAPNKVPKHPLISNETLDLPDLYQYSLSVSLTNNLG